MTTIMTEIAIMIVIMTDIKDPEIGIMIVITTGMSVMEKETPKDILIEIMIGTEDTIEITIMIEREEKDKETEIEIMIAKEGKGEKEIMTGTDNMKEITTENIKETTIGITEADAMTAETGIIIHPTPLIITLPIPTHHTPSIPLLPISINQSCHLTFIHPNQALYQPLSHLPPSLLCMLKSKSIKLMSKST